MSHLKDLIRLYSRSSIYMFAVRTDSFVFHSHPFLRLSHSVILLHGIQSLDRHNEYVFAGRPIFVRVNWRMWPLVYPYVLSNGQ